jgi:hypothetical protein
MKKNQLNLNLATAQMQEVDKDLVNVTKSVFILEIELSFALFNPIYLFIYL